MSERLGKFQNIWVFGSNDALALLIAILAIDLALTLLHSLQVEGSGVILASSSGLKPPTGLGGSFSFLV